LRYAKVKALTTLESKLDRFSVANFISSQAIERRLGCSLLVLMYTAAAMLRVRASDVCASVWLEHFSKKTRRCMNVLNVNKF